MSKPGFYVTHAELPFRCQIEFNRYCKYSTTDFDETGFLVGYYLDWDNLLLNLYINTNTQYV